MAISSMLWAAPPQPPPPGPPARPTPWVRVETPLEALQRAFAELSRTPGLAETVSRPSKEEPVALPPPAVPVASRTWEPRPVLLLPIVSVTSRLWTLLPTTTTIAQEPPTLPDPDLNDDGVVNILDTSLVASCFGWSVATQPEPPCSCGVADNDLDGDVDFDDIQSVIGAFGTTVEKRDTVPPLITAVLDTTPNAAGWHNAPVTVSFACTDCQSGIASCSADVVLATETPAQTVTGTALDLDGTSASTSLVVSLDVTPPEAQILAPTDASASVELTYSDALSGIDLESVTVLIDGVDVTTTLAVDVTGASGVLDPSLAPGEHAILFTLRDVAGNETAISQLFATELAPPPPTVSIESPVEGAFLTSADVPVRVTFTGTGALQVFVDGIDRSSALSNGTGTLDVPDGLHDLEAIVTNAAGTVNATHMFTVDTGTPVVEILAPAAESYHRDPSLVVSGTLEDIDPGTQLECTRGDFTFDAELSIVSSPPGAPVEWRFTCEVALEEGQNSVQAVAHDRVGRQGLATRIFHLDTLAPVVTITEPANGGVANGLTIGVSGGIEDASPVTVMVEGLVSVEATVTGALFQAPVSLESSPDLSEFVIRVVAMDAAGNEGSEFVTISIDRASPTVTIESPAPGVFLQSPVDVTGVLSDSSPIALVEVNGTPAIVSGDSFSAVVPSLDGPLTIEAVAFDAGGNSGSDSVTVNVDSSPPILFVDVPPDAFTTSDSSVLLEGRIEDRSPVSLFVAGIPTPLTSNTFSLDVPLPIEGSNAVPLVARDAAGNEARIDVNLTRDTLAPTLTISAPAQGDLLADLPVVVQGTVQDASDVSVTVNGTAATRTLDAWQVSFASLPEQKNTLTVVATDAARNQSSTALDVILDLTPPVLDVASPPTGFLTNAATIDVSGTVADATAVTLTINGAPVAVAGGSFTATVTLVDGDNPIQVIATDAAGRSTAANLVVTQDAIQPTVELTTPDTISDITSGEVSATVTDNLAVSEVVFLVNGEITETFTEPPFMIELAVPDGAVPGDTVTIALKATDTAGNRASASRGVIVIEDGVIVGQVLSDATGLPVEGATVKLGSRSVQTGRDGKYSLPTGNAEIVLVVEKAGMTTAERRASVLADVGTVPVDARLTPLSPEELVDGQTLQSAKVAIDIPVLGAPEPFRLTPLSAQGLPALLPLGWSPLAAFELQGTLPTPATVRISGLPDEVLEVYIAQYRFSLHEWVLLDAALVPIAGEASFSIPEAGAFAVVAPDAEAPIPAIGEMLEGVDAEIVPDSSSATGVVEPPILPPSGGIAAGTLSLFSPIPLPSGTVIQADITETFSFASGDIASEETRLEDVVLFRQPKFDPDGVLFATFPIASFLTETQQFNLGEIVSGEVNLDFLVGREAVRGERGGFRAVNVEEGNFRLAVPSGSIPNDTAIDLQTFDAFSNFVPTEPGLEPLAEVFVDLSGQSLALDSELSVAVSGLSADDTLVLTRVVRVNGVPRLGFVSLATLAADRVTAPKVREGGRYVFYRIGFPIGFISGVTIPARAVVETTGLPFIALADGSGDYTAPTVTGPVRVTASVPRTSLRAIANVDVVDGETFALDLNLSGSSSTASVTPTEGALRVPVSAQVDIVTTVPLDALTVTTDNLKLFEGDPVDDLLVPTRFVLSGSAKTLAVVPEQSLRPGTRYILAAGTLADVFGGAVSVNQTSFTTRSDQALAIDAEAVSFSLPDDNGIVQITNTTPLPAGATVLIVNAANGTVLTLTVDNVGGLTGELRATISDRLLVTLTDPTGSVITFEKSKFVAEDGTTAIGSGGGVVEGTGGVELRIPEGALEQGVVLKIEAFDETLFPANERPDIPGGMFGGGLRIHSDDEPTFKKEVDLVFPKPAAAPDGASYYVHRRLEGPLDAGGSPIILFETIDQAFVEGDGPDAKVVTASYPFSGYLNSFGRVDANGMLHAAPTVHLGLSWTDVPIPLPGVVTGNVFRAVVPPNDPENLNPAPQFKPVVNALVSGVDAGSRLLFASQQNATVAVTQGDGKFTLFDAFFTGGTVQIAATVGFGGPNPSITACPATPGPADTVRCATAFELSADDLARQNLIAYAHVATANITFPPSMSTPQPTAIKIRVMELLANGERSNTNGVVEAGSKLLIVFDSEIDVRGVSINGEHFGIRVDPLRGEAQGADFVTDGEFTPTSAGSYTVVATALPPVGSIVRSTATFLAVAPGGSNNDPLPDEAPALITSRTWPRPGAKNVSTDVTLQAAFSEPVRGIPAGVSLADDSGTAVQLKLAGVGPSGPIAEITTGAEEVTSVTIQPAVGLKVGTEYTLEFNANIHDLDVDSKALSTVTSTFTTFGPRLLTPPGAGDTFPSPRNRRSARPSLPGGESLFVRNAACFRCFLPRCARRTSHCVSTRPEPSCRYRRGGFGLAEAYCGRKRSNEHL